MIEVLRLASRCPFTCLMLASLTAAGVYARTHVGPLDADFHRHVGSSAHLLSRGELHRVVTSLFFTAGGWQFYTSLLMFAGAVGWLEATAGTRVAAVAFTSIHGVTVVAMAIGIGLLNTLATSHRGSLLWSMTDVGPSAGYYGCLGIALGRLGLNNRPLLILAVLTILVARVIWSSYQLSESGRMMSADLAHLIAFPLGVVVARFVGNL